jgi:hypothetical protein
MPRDVFAAWQHLPLELERFRALTALERLRYLLGFSLLAPSTHNSVPQLYGLGADYDNVTLLLDRRQVLPASDARGRQALISVGCALENFEAAARAYGLGCEWLPSRELSWAAVERADSRGPLLLGKARLLLSAAESAAATPVLAADHPQAARSAAEGNAVPDEAERRACLQALLERRAVRAEYDPTARLPAGLEAGLERCARVGGGVSVRLFFSAAERFSWGKLDELAMKHKLEQLPFQRELGASMLSNDDMTSARGMRGREFGLDDRRSRELARELSGERPMPTDQLAMLARGGRVTMQSSTAVCALAADDAPLASIELGRVYQRCALLAWRHGIAHAVHTGVCEVPHARAMCRATLMSGTPGPGVVFRLGVPLARADWERPHSSRPALDDIIVPV